jgi:hypothetical protein
MPIFASKPWPGVRVDPGHPVGKDVVLALALNERAGATAYNLAGADSCAMTGSPSWTSGAGGSALSLNGSTQYGLVAAAAQYRPAAGFTLLMRLLMTNTSQSSPAYMRIDDGTNRVGFIDLSVVGGIRIGAWNSGGTAITAVSATGVMTSNNWYHLAGTFDPRTMGVAAYVNGSLVASATGSGTAYAGSSPAPVGIGVNPALLGGAKLQAQVDYAVMVGRPLTAGEVAAFAGNPWAIYRPTPLAAASAAAALFRRTLYPRAGSRGVA